jgi:hypothetical protein
LVVGRYANDVLVWSETLTTSSGSQVCGSSTSTWNEEHLHRTVDIGWVETSSVTLRWTTTLSGSATSDESWGLSDVAVYTYDACDSVPVYQSDFALDGTSGGWLFVGPTPTTTTCGTSVLLGGYNVMEYDDELHRLFELPLHTSIKVSACVRACVSERVSE